MSRFFKSAAFPILIVIVLAFFVQKLIGSTSHPPKQTFSDLLTQLDNHEVKTLTLKTKDNTVDVQLMPQYGGQKYTVGYPDNYASTLIQDAQKDIGPGARSTSRARPPTAGCRCSPTSCRS
jgi:cell division protease FtsH